MVPLLDQPGFKKRALPVSVKAWHQMIAKGLAPKRAELLRGVIVEKMSKSVLHTRLTGRLLRILQSAFDDSFYVQQEAPLTFADSEPEPDLSVAVGSEGDYLTRHPATAKLVVEVSISTLAEDRELATLYAEALVDEYWIVNGRGRELEIYRQPADGRYQQKEVISLHQTAVPQSLPGLEVSVATLFQGLTDLPVDEPGRN